MTTTTHPTTEAFAALLAAANEIRHAMSEINRHGDDYDRALTLQADGHAYGELYDGLKLLVRSLYPDDIGDHTVDDRAMLILDAVYHSDVSIEEAARHVADLHAPPVDPAAELLGDWFAEVCRSIYDNSSDIVADLRDAVARARAKAERFGIDWDVPDHIRDMTTDDDEEG